MHALVLVTNPWGGGGGGESLTCANEHVTCAYELLTCVNKLVKFSLLHAQIQQYTHTSHKLAYNRVIAHGLDPYLDYHLEKNYKLPSAQMSLDLNVPMGIIIFHGKTNDHITLLYLVFYWKKWDIKIYEVWSFILFCF